MKMDTALPSLPEYKANIRQPIASRRRKGQFYTITPLAQRGWEYVEKTLGKDFYKDGTWRIWENSAGQGALVINVIPDDALQWETCNQPGENLLLPFRWFFFIVPMESQPEPAFCRLSPT